MGCAIAKEILWYLTIGNSVYVHPVIWQKIENLWFTQNRSDSTWGCKSPSLIVPLWKIFSVFSSSLFPLTFKPIFGWFGFLATHYGFHFVWRIHGNSNIYRIVFSTFSTFAFDLLFADCNLHHFYLGQIWHCQIRMETSTKTLDL